jgi:MtrB/PioB family decaheme-associated outer membrane protein
MRYRALTLIGLITAVCGSAQANVSTADFERLTRADNHVEIGLGYVSDHDPRFGRYNALYQDGIFVILGLNYLIRPRYDQASPDYLVLSIRDADLSNRLMDIEAGRQGDYFLHARYRERSARWGDGLQTIYPEPHGPELNLPGDWTAGPTTAQISAGLPVLHEFNLRQRRREATVGGGKHFAERWTVSADVRQEDRDGSRTLAGMFGNTGGNPRAAFLPIPVDYRTRHIDLALNYAENERQLRLAYHASLFTNNEPSIRFANPFSTIAGWAPGSGFPDGVGQIALPPDNQFHQISAAGGWQFTPRIRGLAEIAFSRMTQDEAFLPLTANPTLAASVSQSLPATSLDGRIDTTNIHLRVNGHTSPRFQWNASYRLNDRDNRTPSREFVYIGADSQIQDIAETSSRRRFNLPYDDRRQQLRFDGNWRLPDRTRLNAGISRQRIERSFVPRARSDEDSVDIRAQRPVGAHVQLAVQAHWANRRGSDYDGAAGFLAGHDPRYTDTLAGQWANLPALRMHHLADRRRARLGINAIINPHEQWSLSLEAARVSDDYRRSELGLTDADIDSWTTHLSWTPDRKLSAHAFLSRERLSSNQTGLALRGGPNRLPDSTNPERSWLVTHRDRVDTFGIGFQRHWQDERLSLAGDFVYARANGNLSVTTGADLTAAPLPAVRNRLSSVMLRGSYRVSQPLSLHLRYWQEDFRASDWALDGVAIDQLANVLLPGETSPDYRVHVISAAVNYRF